MKKLIMLTTIIFLTLGTSMSFAQEVERKKCAQDFRLDIKTCISEFQDAKDLCNEEALDFIEDECLDLDTTKEVRKCIKDAINVKKGCKKDAISDKKNCFSDARVEKKQCFSDARKENVARTEKKKNKK